MPRAVPVPLYVPFTIVASAYVTREYPLLFKLLVSVFPFRSIVTALSKVRASVRVTSCVSCTFLPLVAAAFSSSAVDTGSKSHSQKGIWEFDEDQYTAVHIDLVFPILHGKNGEDGTLQGMFELSGIPVIGCNTLASALCMDKDRAHKLVSLAGVKVPKSVTFKRSEKNTALKKIETELSYPLFVKPVRAGSSFGITKVTEQAEINTAIESAFEHDTEVIVEEAIGGFEVGCAILGIDNLTVGRIDEIELSNGFFDYTEKYTLKTSKIHMPARLSPKEEKRVQETAVAIYKALGCSGFARVDMFYTPSNEIIFNEVNTIPGLTSHSRYPNMMKGIGLSFADMLDKLISLYVE